MQYKYTTSDQSFVETGKLKIYPDTSHIIPLSYIPLCFVIKNKIKNCIL